MPGQAPDTTHRGQAPQKAGPAMLKKALPTHPSLRHPITGQPLRAVGRRRDGRLIWPVMGGAPDGGDGGTGGDSGGDAGAGSAGGDGDGSGAGSGDAGGTGDADKAGDQGDKDAAGKVEDLPDWAQKLIKDTRGEAAENRTKATAAEKKLTEQLDGIAKALGLKEDEKTDPAKLASELAKAQDQARQTSVELAVYRTAGKHQGDPDALLDSRGFLAKLADLDPTDEKFTSKVETAIKDAVKDNPKLKATQAAGSSSADHGTGGTGEGGAPRKPKSMADAVASTLGT